MNVHRIALFYLWIHFCELNLSLWVTVDLPSSCYYLLMVVNGNMPQGRFLKSTERIKILIEGSQLRYRYKCGEAYYKSAYYTISTYKPWGVKDYTYEKCIWTELLIRGRKENRLHGHFHQFQVEVSADCQAQLPPASLLHSKRSMNSNTEPPSNVSIVSGVIVIIKEQLQHLFLPRRKEFSI